MIVEPDIHCPSLARHRLVFGSIMERLELEIAESYVIYRVFRKIDDCFLLNQFDVVRPAA